MTITANPDSHYTAAWTNGHGAVEYFHRHDGSRLRYFRGGNGPAVVLLHTVRTQLDYFQRVIPKLWNHFTVYALDLPGMGWSDIVAGSVYDATSLRAAVVEFVSQLDAGEITLAGESLGAALSLGTAPELPNRLRRVVAFNSYDYPEGLERGNWVAKLIGSSMRMPVYGPLFASMESRPILAAILRGGFVDPKRLPMDFVRELRRSGKRAGYPKVARAIARSLNGFIAQRQRYSDITVPVTLIYSEHDWSRPAERRYVEQLVPNTETITLPNTGHFSALERPADMARILLQTRLQHD
jgi:pimeloyl-ACP methyl ester carboxylesterase